MLKEQTITKMQSMKLHGMAQVFQELLEKPQRTDLTHEEFIGLLVDAEVTSRDNRRLQRLLKQAHLKQEACLEDIDYRHPRGLHKQTILELSDCTWIESHNNVLITGPTGVGKSYIACALGNATCRKGRSSLYIRGNKLFKILSQAEGDGSYLKTIGKLLKFDLLIIDDIGMSPMKETERRDLLEIVEERNLSSSTIVTSQVPIKDWYQIIGDPTIADAICDRLLHNAYRIELKGESMRKNIKI